MENEIFKKCKPNFKKIEEYGFERKNNYYIFEKYFLDNDFKAIITINEDGLVRGEVIDLQFDEEYKNIKTEMNGKFVNKVRNIYLDILNDIKKNCFDESYFIFDQTNRVNKYIKKRYNCEPEFLWKKFPKYAVYRNKKNNKWFGIIMNLELSKLEKGSGEVEIINIKLNRDKVKKLLSKKGFFEVYHMNKVDWISIILNDTLYDEEIFLLIDESNILVDYDIISIERV